MSVVSNFYEFNGFSSSQAACEDLARLSIDLERTGLFLDFDGTLVAIAERPDQVELPDNARKILDRLESLTGGNVAIISGRSIADLKKYFPKFRGVLAGGHGAELRLPDGSEECIECDMERVEHLKKAAREFVSLHPSVDLEEKPTGLVLHYRGAPELEGAVVHYCQALVAGGNEGFEMQHAKMAAEIKPEGADKARIIARIADELFDSGKVLFFAGDDLTDESGFNLVTNRGGYSVKIGNENTGATYRTESPQTFIDWLFEQAGERPRQ